MNNFKPAFVSALAAALCLFCGQVQALGDQWYFGFGGGASWLQPNPVQPGLGLSERQGVGGSVFLGRDLDDRSSGQLTLYGLGEATLENDEVVPYYAFDGSVVYRLYDSRDARLSREGIAVALYGRFALGYIERETDVPLSNDAAVYFGAGGGAEVFFTRNFSMRAEGMYHDRDAASASLQLVARFGGARTLRPREPRLPPSDSSASLPAEPTLPTPSVSEPALTEPALPEPAVPEPSLPEPTLPTPATPQATQPSVPTGNDADADGVPDASDQCLGSVSGYPVRPTGCALFDGVLSGVSFAPGSAELLPGATDQLDYLANVMTQYPQSRIELHSHTDAGGNVRDQAILTRARLKTIGTYLLQRGVRANRMVLRSFGGTQPLYDNGTAAGRNGNNRIEVLESITR